MKHILLTFTLLTLTGCGVNLVLRTGIDIDPSIERLTSDMRDLMQTHMGDKEDDSN